MSIKISGPSVLATKTTTLLGSAMQASVAFRIRVEPGSADITAGTYFGRSNGRSFSAAGVTTSSGKPGIRLQIKPTTGAAFTYTFNYVPGRSYSVVLVWDATASSQVIYLDGVAVLTASTSTPFQDAASSTIQIGSTAMASGAVFSIDDCALWGLPLTASDAAALRDRTATPASLYPGSLSWGASLDGADGASVFPGDPGLADPVAALNLAPSGTGTAAWSADPLAYSPPTVVTAKVLKSGKTIAFFFNDSITGEPRYVGSVAANPTISVGGGAPIALSNPLSSAVTVPPSPLNSSNLPYVQYAIDQVSPSDALTYSAPAGWALLPIPTNTLYPATAAPAATDAAVVNGTGQANFAVPEKMTMKLGANVGEATYFTTARCTRNLARTSAAWTGITGFDADGYPAGFTGTSGGMRLPDASAANGIDSLAHVAPTSIPWMPNNPDIYTIVWDEASPSNNSNFRIMTSARTMSDSKAIIAERTDLAQNPPDGKRRRRSFNVTRPANPSTWGLGLYVWTDRTDWSNLYVFGPGNAIDFDAAADEVLIAYLDGGSVTRYLDILRINNSNIAAPDQLRKITDSNGRFARPQWVTVSRGDPVDNVADYAFANTWTAIKFTTPEPHGLYTGQFLTFQNFANVTFSTPVSLAADVTSTTATSITLADASAVVAQDFLVFGSEWMRATAIAGNVVTVARGVNGTTAATYSAGASGTNYPQAFYAEDGVTRRPLNAAEGTIVVKSPTTFETMLGSSVRLKTTTTNAYPGQVFLASAQVGASTITDGMSYTEVCRVASSIGQDVWILVPFPATDDCVAAIAAEVRDNTVPGRKIYVEFSNEIWNSGQSFIGQYLGALIQGNKQKPKITGPKWGALRASQVHAIFEEVLGAAGRADDLVRVVGYQWGGASSAADFLDFCVAHSIPIDAYAIAPYRDFPSALLPAIDGYDAEQMHDAWQLFLTWNWPYDASLPGSNNDVHYRALKARYPDAKMVAYESGLEGILPAGASNLAVRSHDIVNHPRMYDTYTAFLTTLQNGGFDLVCQYQVNGSSGWGSSPSNRLGCGGWTQYFWHGQQWGYGDGSDGKANNLDHPAAGKAPNVQQDYYNVAVMPQAWKDWAAALPDRNINASSTSSSGTHGSATVSIDNSVMAISLQGGGVLSGAAMTLNVIWISSAFSLSANLTPATFVSNTSLSAPTTSGIGATSAVSIISGGPYANPNTLNYFKGNEPTPRIAGKSITTNLDFFGRAEPFTTASQVVSVSLIAPAYSIQPASGDPTAAVVSDQIFPTFALIGDGEIASATIDIDSYIVVSSYPGSAVLTPTFLSFDQSSGVNTTPGDGSLGESTFSTDSQFTTGILQAAGSQGLAAVIAARLLNPNDLRNFKRGEPEAWIAGKVPTTGLGYFRRGQPFHAIIVASTNPTTPSAALSASGSLAATSIHLDCSILTPPLSTSFSLRSGTISNDVLISTYHIIFTGLCSPAIVSTDNVISRGVFSGSARLGTAEGLIGTSTFAMPIAGDGVIGAVSNLGSIALAVSSLEAGGDMGVSGSIANSSTTSTALANIGSLGTASGRGDSTGLAAAFDFDGTCSPAFAIADSLIEATEIFATGSLSATAINGGLLLTAEPNTGTGTMNLSSIIANSLAIAPTFPFSGMASSASLATDIRLQAAGFDMPGAMGPSYFSNDSLPTILALAGSGTIFGGGFLRSQKGKRYILPRRSCRR